MMKATKYNLQINIEVLSKDCLSPLIEEVLNHLLFNEVEQGSLRKDDGDYVSWFIDKKEVSF